ncbi:DUF3054 domain-containing protein [Williamsia sp. CHRR-6]|uniref:DUF3054 domain-containing protein n=1 Tax=Williamsia sp. CHRR-6 TaxID=2835871 RepID=UPI001BDA39F7|nr:DUF3054 domain-containing protein [Williamsia sp. CHRR-6]MBT0567498.1 DUF3054 domain-containing protein [Williamsia sp. CHRR-6]
MSTTTTATRRSIGVSAVFDAVTVAVFVTIGRSNHHDGLSVSGIASTFWPFAVGAAVGWAITYVLGTVRAGGVDKHHFRPARVVPAGVIIWVSTVAVGMSLRVGSGQGTAVSFIIVASVFLGVFFLGWRTVRALLTKS